jgi:hypothetical protein
MKRMHRIAALLLFATLSLSAAAPKPKPAPTIAPKDIPHPIAQFLRTLSNDGGRTVTYKATAIGTHFFFEEPSGVTVYRFEKGAYVKETFLRGSKLPAVVKRYAKS